MRNEGEKTPDIAFLASEISVNKLWREFYSEGLYEDLWFQWKGKPLLLYGQHEIPSRNLVNEIEFSEEIQKFFNLKQSWAWTSLPWYDSGEDEWPWVDHFPQAISWTKNNSKEMVPVSVAQHPLSNIGRSFHNFHQPETNIYDVTPVTDKGLYFQEQWDRALEVDPEFIFVTGWNEWSAHSQVMTSNISEQLQKWKFYPGAHLGKVGEELNPGDVYFIDQYNQEYSRDIEPMKNGHTDNYYYQLMANIRRYKGMPAPQIVNTKSTISMEDGFLQWENVQPIYLDHVGDIHARNSKKQGKAGPYINSQGRNDIIESRVAYDDHNFYFYVKTSKSLSPQEKNWMYLFIDSDQDTSTGWEGYEYMLNGNGISPDKTSIKKFNNKKRWVKLGEVEYKVLNNNLMLSLPRRFIKSQNFDFHWVDNPIKIESIIDFFTAGDNAPERRANFQFKSSPF